MTRPLVYPPPHGCHPHAGHQDQSQRPMDVPPPHTDMPPLRVVHGDGSSEVPWPSGPNRSFLSHRFSSVAGDFARARRGPGVVGAGSRDLTQLRHCAVCHQLLRTHTVARRRLMTINKSTYQRHGRAAILRDWVGGGSCIFATDTNVKNNNNSRMTTPFGSFQPCSQIFLDKNTLGGYRTKKAVWDPKDSHTVQQRGHIG